ARGRVADGPEPLPHLVDAPRARCGVHLDHVQPVVVAYAPAGVAVAAWGRRDRRERQAVEAPGEDAGGRGLARAARAAEQVPPRGPAGLQRVPERPRDVLLAHQVLEAARPAAAARAGR